MKWRTTTRPNGQRDHRETILGWDVWLPRLVSIAGIVGGIWVASARITSIENKLESQAVNLPDKIAAAIAANEKGTPYVTRDEWERHNADVADALKTSQAENRRLLQYLIEGDRYNRRVLSQIDLTPGKKENQ